MWKYACLLITCTSLVAGAEPADTSFKLVEYKDVLDLTDRLAESPLHGKIFATYNGFERYAIDDLPTCPPDGQPCRNPIFEVTSFYKGEAHVESLPVVLLVGGMHGNEVAGTNALYQLIRIFENWWTKKDFFKVLLERVRLVIVPMSNPSGFSRMVREETTGSTSLDPNRDFPYDAPECFQTSTARMLDAIFTNHLVVGCLTYHGGDNSISYPWGNFPHQSNTASDDNTAFVAVAKMLREVSGENPSYEMDFYETGTMTETVYPVRGGFEDYAYGAGFDSQAVNKVCTYQKQDGTSKTIPVKYQQPGPRAFVYLVEASSSKFPSDKFLGQELVTVNEEFDSKTYGHNNRCINLALRYSQAMHPFFQVTSVASGQDGYEVVGELLGCITLDGVTTTQGQGEISIIQKIYDERRNRWTVTLRLKGEGDSLGQFSIECDASYRADANAKSHFLRLKTGLDKEITGPGSKIKSFEALKVSILGLLQAKSGPVWVKWNPDNIHTVIPVTSWAVTEGVTLTWKDGSVIVAMDSQFTRIDIQDWEQVGIPPADQQPPLHQIKKGEPVELSLQHFLDLLGKPASVYCSSNPIAPCLESVIHLPQGNQSGLVPSENGVVGFVSKGSIRFLIMGQMVTPFIFRVTIISQSRTIRKLDLDPTGSIPFSEEVVTFNSRLFMIIREYRSSVPDSFLVMGRVLEVVDFLGDVHPFLFTPKNPTLSFQALAVTFFRGGDRLSPVVMPVIMFSSLIVMLLVALLGISKSKNILREPLDHTVQAVAIVE